VEVVHRPVGHGERGDLLVQEPVGLPQPGAHFVQQGNRLGQLDLERRGCARGSEAEFRDPPAQ